MKLCLANQIQLLTVILHMGVRVTLDKNDHYKTIILCQKLMGIRNGYHGYKKRLSCRLLNCARTLYIAAVSIQGQDEY